MGRDRERWGEMGSDGERWGEMGSDGERWGEMGSDGERWGVAGKASLTHLPLTSRCAARFLTGLWPGGRGPMV